tara:strand:- start:972 stop:1478 length:507 start_codon:yes stop_codon:yes gene_type:complete
MALKTTSEIIQVGFSITETAPSTFTQVQVDLQLNPLDQEVALIYAVDLDPSAPENIAGVNTATLMSLSSTSLGNFGNLSSSTVLSNAVLDIRQEAGGITAVPFNRTSFDTPPSNVPYIGIISTSNFFVQLKGVNNLFAKSGFGRVWMARAKADAATYAALVQSEVLSA